MSSRSPLPGSLAIELLTRLATCRDQLKDATEQLRQSHDDKDAFRTAQETIDFLNGSKAFKSRPPALFDRRGMAKQPCRCARRFAAYSHWRLFLSHWLEREVDEYSA